jgi:hypothetical protein
MSIQEIWSKYSLYWQYPVITEKEFSRQNNSDENYVSIPWATIIDKLTNGKQNSFDEVTKDLYRDLKTKKASGKLWTCCQHIHLKKYITYFKIIGIKTIYWPHKIIGEDTIDGIHIVACPLYAVNVEDSTKSSVFKGKDLAVCSRPLLYNFMGGYMTHYLTSIRQDLFDMKHPTNTMVRNTGVWHFNDIVYTDKQNIDTKFKETESHSDNTETYNKLMIGSDFCLCPSGSGPNSIRFWEALGVGTIPVLLADTLDLPDHPLWESTILKIKEKDFETIPEILTQMSATEIAKRRDQCIDIYAHFRTNFANRMK